MYKKLTKSILLYGLGAGLSQSVLIFLVPVYTKYFSKEQYATLEIIQSLLIFLMIFGVLQIESAVGRYYYEKEFKKNKKKYISTAFSTILILSVVITCVCVYMSEMLSNLLFDTTKWSTTIKFALLTVPLSAIFSFFTVLIRYDEKPVIYGIITFLQVITTVAVALLMVINKKTGVIGVFYGQISGFLIGLISYSFYYYKYINLIIYKDILKKYLSFSLPLIPGVLGGWSNNHLNRFIMLSFLSLSQIGIYAAAYKIASIFKLLEIAFRMAWQPFFIEQYTTNENHKELFKNIFKIAFIFILFLVFLTLLFSKSITQFLLPVEYKEVQDILPIISLSFALIILTSIVNLGPVLKKKTIYNTYSSFISVLINIGFIFILTPYYGIVGVSLSLLFANSALFFSSLYFSEKIYPIYFNKRSS